MPGSMSVTPENLTHEIIRRVRQWVGSSGPAFFAIKAEVVAAREHLLEDEDCVVEPSGAAEGANVQERPHRERALGAVQSSTSVV
jgi:hypothetical protein